MFRLIAAVFTFFGCYAFCYGVFPVTQSSAIVYHNLAASYGLLISVVVAAMAFKAMKD